MFMSTVPTSARQLPSNKPSSSVYAPSSPFAIEPIHDDRVKSLPAPLPSALATARIINDLGSIPYPEGVKRPSAELNIGAKDNKFRYDREFLLQFMSICTAKPDMLPPLDAIGLEPSEGNFPMSRGGSGRHRPQTSNASLAAPQRQASAGGYPFGKASFNPFHMGMGNFGPTTSSELSSDVSARTASGFRPGPAVSFGSIDDDVNSDTPISSSPASTPTPPIKSAGVKSFGSVPATVSQVNGKSAVQITAKPASSPVSGVAKIGKVDIAKLFKGSSSASTSAPSQPSSGSDAPSSQARPLPTNKAPPPMQPWGQYYYPASMEGQPYAAYGYSGWYIPDPGQMPPQQPPVPKVVALTQRKTTAKPTSSGVAKIGKVDVAKLFQSSSSASTSAPSPPSSPSVRPAVAEEPCPSHTPPGSSSPYQQFVPQNGMRQPPSSAGPNGAQSGPKSPQYRHALPNGAASRMPSGPTSPPQTSSSGGSGSWPSLVVPLKATANRWDRKSLAVAPDSPEIVDLKVKSLLNKLTMENFDTISDQIIAWANKSQDEKDGRTLVQVIRLVFEHAIDEAAWSGMYARLCRKMMERISKRVQDDGIKGQGGAPITGGQLFLRYLLNQCREAFEREWVAKETTTAGKAGQDEANIEVYYAAQKAKRQGVGLFKFLGELFKLQMFTERIMHGCVKKLLANLDNPEEEEIESLCTLLATVGKMLDTHWKARAQMDVYFSRMKELRKSSRVSSRMQFMLQDIIELRERRWVSRNAVAAPATIAQIHEAAAREKAEKESYQRQMAMSRGEYRWTTAGSAPRAPPKAGDLFKFGQINKGSNAPLTFGPQSNIYVGKKDNKRDSRDSIERTNTQNMFSMLQAEPSAPKEPTQRKRLVLAPRAKPIEFPTAETEQGSDDEVESPAEESAPEMSAADAKKKIEEDVQEFFTVRNLEEAEDYFKSLPKSHHHLLVDKLVSSAIESKQEDAQLVGDLFARASSKSLCASAAFEEGIAPVAEFLDDITIDAPKAPNLLAIMIKGADLSEDQRTRIASKSEESGAELLELIEVRVRRHPIEAFTSAPIRRAAAYPAYNQHRKQFRSSTFSESVPEAEVKIMSFSEAKEKIAQYSKEFLLTRDLEEAETYFKSLHATHHYLLVDDLIYSTIESSEADARLVGEFFARVSLKRLCSPAAFEEGIAPTVDFLDDIAHDAPGAPELLAIMMKGATRLSDVQRARIARRSEEHCAKLLELSKPYRLPFSVRRELGMLAMES